MTTQANAELEHPEAEVTRKSEINKDPLAGGLDVL